MNVQPYEIEQRDSIPLDGTVLWSVAERQLRGLARKRGRGRARKRGRGRRMAMPWRRDENLETNWATLLEGSESLTEVIERLEGFAAQLCDLVDEGFILSCPVTDDGSLFCWRSL